jgi:type I restriction enzyme S subunit
MKYKIEKLGTHIREVSSKNANLRVDRLLGVSFHKRFIPSQANIIGTDLSTYKIVKNSQFAYGPVTSRNGDKISIALLEDQEECIISSSYTVFEIIDTSKLLPQFLMLWFSRPEFDRYARFMSHGSVREIFGWEEMCNVELPVPALNVQLAISLGEYFIKNHKQS